MAQTLLSEKKSTAGSPYMFYTVEVTPSNRTATGVTISLTVKCHLQYSESTSGTGITYTAGLYVGDSWRELQLKSSSDSWSGTTVHTKSTSFTVTGLSATTTSLTGIKFRVVKKVSGSTVTTGGYLAETSVSNITIPVGNSASSFTLNSDTVRLGDSLIANINRVESSNYHKIVGTLGSNSHTFISNAGTSATLTFDESTFGSWFGTTSVEVTITITLITYGSSGTNLGSTTEEITLKIPEDLGKPSTPTAVKTSETATGATIAVTQPTTFKYGATFSEWEVTTNEGTISVSGDTVTASIDVNKTVVVSIRAVDSRGLKSDVVNIVCHIRKRGVCLYKDGIWKHMKARHYNGAWVKSKPYVCDGSNWHRC